MYPYNEECMIYMKTLFNYIETLETPYEKEHGRIEKRTYYISYDTNCIHDKKK